MTDIVFESVNKFLVGFHGIDISNKQLASNKELRKLCSIIDGRRIQLDGIGSHSFIALMNIKRWEARLKVLTHGCILYFSSKLRGGQKSFLDCVGRDSTKTRAQGVVIAFISHHVVLI
jgi:hypothetical protein